MSNRASRLPGNTPEANTPPCHTDNATPQAPLGTPIRECLADLALGSLRADDLADQLEESYRHLSDVLERQPHLDGLSQPLRSRLKLLRTLHQSLAQQITRYSHAYEDVVTLTSQLPKGEQRCDVRRHWDAAVAAFRAISDRVVSCQRRSQ